MRSEELVMKENVVVEKSKAFAVRIIQLYKYMYENKKEFVMLKQILRSGQALAQILQRRNVPSAKKTFLQKCILHLKSVRKQNIGLSYYIKLNT